MCKLSQLVTADHEPQPIASFAQPFILPLIYKRMVSAPAGLHIFRRFGETIFREIDVPIALCGRFCDLLGLVHRPGVARFLVEFIRINPRSFFGLSNAQAASLVSILAGAVLLWRVKSQFRALKKEHRIVDHLIAQGDVLQQEYHKPTPECPHPERWHMYDSMTAEVEVLDFLKSIVTTKVKMAAPAESTTKTIQTQGLRSMFGFYRIPQLPS